MIPKQGKDLTKLESWHPLSILNTDYKIIAKVLARRLKVALSEIINPDQIGYMQNRFCGENIRLISDIIDYCTLLKNPCLILLADFQKAFNKIRWNLELSWLLSKKIWFWQFVSKVDFYTLQ